MRIILPILLIALLSACGQGETELIAGYKYVGLGGSHAIIDGKTNSGAMVVDPDVIQYEIIDPYIVGERADAKIDDRLSKKFGYFIFNTRNGRLLEGLNENEFQKELKSRNLHTSSFD